MVAINPPPKPQPKWTGNLSGAVTSTHGNTKAEAVSASVSVARRSEKDRTTAGADYGRSEQRDRDTGEEETTEDWWRARAQYDYFFTKKFFGFGNIRYERDAIADLDRRVVVGGGGGYQWIETDKTSFSTGLGLASLYEKFDNQDDSNSEISLQLGYNLDHRITDTLRFVHDLTYYPSLEQFSDYYLDDDRRVAGQSDENDVRQFQSDLQLRREPRAGSGQHGCQIPARRRHELLKRAGREYGMQRIGLVLAGGPDSSFVSIIRR